MEPHIKRGAFVLVQENLDLVDIALAIAANDEATIQKHIQEANLSKGDEESFEAWKQEKTFFNFIIIQPFVVAQKFVKLNPAPMN